MKVIFFIVIILIFSCSRKTDDYSSATPVEIPKEQKTPVELLIVKKGKLIPYIQASGIVNGVHEVWIISETSGIITSSNLKLGSYIEKNEIVLRVENDLAKLKLDLTNQQYISSKLDFEGNKKSFESGNISRSQYNSSLINLLTAENNYEISKKIFESTSMKSPIKGFVATKDRTLTPGNYISSGAKVAKIIDNSSFVMQINLGQGQIDLINTGSEVEITINIGYEDLLYTGIVEAIGAGSNIESGSFPVIIKWKTKNGNSKLKSGMSAKAIIKTSSETETIVVPDRALIKRGEQNYVFIEQDDSALLIEVSAGNSFGGKTIINSGLNPDDKLIISSLNTINEGSKIVGSIVGTTKDWK